MAPCVDCGDLHDDPGPRCRMCAPRASVEVLRGSAHERGYTSQWTRLSRAARRRQPWCSDCGATRQLTADHSPEAWRRRELGLPIRLDDVEVVCGPCNTRRGTSRPGSRRSEEA